MKKNNFECVLRCQANRPTEIFSEFFSLSKRQPRYKEITTVHHFPKLTGYTKLFESCKKIGIRSNTTYKCTGCGKHLHIHCWSPDSARV